MIYVVVAQLCVVIFLLFKIANNQVTWSHSQHNWMTEIRDQIVRLKDV